MSAKKYITKIATIGFNQLNMEGCFTVNIKIYQTFTRFIKIMYENFTNLKEHSYDILEHFKMFAHNKKSSKFLL